MASKFYKSPFCYVGNKYKQLPQLIKIFPEQIDNFIDLFTGGCDVAQNMISRANKVYANDINKIVIDIMREFQNHSIDEILSFIDKRIEQFNLSKTNKEGYITYRELYNNGTYSTPLDLFTLARFSFNNNMRFNNNGEMNSAFGMNRSSFNPVQRKNTIALHKNLQSIILSSKSFLDFDLSYFGKNDFIYADPPYLISDAYYNNGAKEAAQRWEQNNDLQLFEYLDKANAKGIRFAMSNFIHHKGKTNEKIIEWINDNKYNVYDVNSSYTNCVYCAIKTDQPTLEAVITNYK